jgi:DNA repair exonuclease SbcCD ATPase subunit
MKKKDENKNTHYTLSTKIKELNSSIDLKRNNIERINGEIILLKKNITRFENEILQLKNSKTCPTCGQPVQADKQSHIQDRIDSIYEEIGNTNKDISEKELSKNPIQKEISDIQAEINQIKLKIDENSLQMEEELNEIGLITNDKNEVERREKLSFELSTIPTKIDNVRLTYDSRKRVLSDFNSLQDKIAENKKIEATLEKAKERLTILKNEQHTLIADVENYKSRIGNKKQTIASNNDLLAKFEEQEKRDYVFKVYEECIHRDGIPTHLLKNMAIPKINRELAKLFEELNFKVWFDLSDLKLKMAYNTSPNSVINAISGSGKERTFASICLKFALNQINAKSKPSIFLLDEIMGKLTDDSVTEFTDILHKIKEKTKKLLVVEHKYEISPDHIIEVSKDDRGISKLEIY